MFKVGTYYLKIKVPFAYAQICQLRFKEDLTIPLSFLFYRSFSLGDYGGASAPRENVTLYWGEG